MEGLGILCQLVILLLLQSSRFLHDLTALQYHAWSQQAMADALLPIYALQDAQYVSAFL